MNIRGFWKRRKTGTESTMTIISGKKVPRISATGGRGILWWKCMGMDTADPGILLPYLQHTAAGSELEK